MRFDELRLQAFGPFTNLVLDLRGGAPGGLHVIYGPNEAGKSTSLRAVVNLLFGIPQRSQDAHLHPSARLAVGAVLRAHGQTFDVTRLKRTRDSLVDPKGAAWTHDPIPELIGHLDRVSFCTRFGLDQFELEKGAEALLGGSEQGLFAAGTAGADVRRVLTQLSDEAAALFLPRGKLPLLNRYAADYELALGEARRAERPVEKWLAQKRAHEQALEHAAQVGRRRAEVRAELRRLQRLKAVLSDLLEWQTATQRLAELSSVPDLPADAPALRSKLNAQMVESQAELRRIAEDLATFERELAQLKEPSPLADVDDEQLQLAARVGTAIAARKDLPKRRAALIEHQRQLSTLLRELGQDPAPGDEVAVARRVVMGAEGSAHIARLIAQHSGLSTHLKAAEAQLRKLHSVEQDLEQTVLPVQGLSLSLLEALSSEGKAANQLWMESLSEHKAHAQNAAEIERLRALLRCRASWQHLVAELPAEAWVRSWSARHDQLREQSAIHQRAQHELEQQLQEGLAKQNAPLDLPSLSELEILRKTRDDMLLAIDGNDPAQRQVLRQLVSAIDSLVDQLLAQADKVYAVQALERSNRQLQEQLTIHKQASQEVAQLEAGAWRDLSEVAARLQAAVPHSPDVVGQWFEQLNALAKMEMEQQSRGVELARRKSVVQRAEEKLRRALGEDAKDCDLLGLLRLLDDALRSLEKAEQRQLQWNKARRSLRRDQEEAVLALDQAREQLNAWTQAWQRSLAPLGLGPDTSVERAQEVLTALGRIERAMEAAVTLESRIVGMERDTQALKRDISRYVAQFLPAVQHEEDTVDRASRLLEAVRLERRNRDEWFKARALVDERRMTLAAVESRSVSAHQALQAMMRAAHVESEESLAVVEQQSLEKRQLKIRVDELAERIRISADGAPTEELLSEAAQWGGSVRRLIVRIDDLEQESTDLEAEFRRAENEAEGMRLGLLTYKTEDVALARQVVFERAALARKTLRQYLVCQAAHSMLQGQIAQYAERFSGPICQRASEMFARITLGKYSRLSVGLGDKTLRCVRDGHEVEVSELSRGARAQLYFVLRLASLEQYFSEHSPVPIVLDDLFVDFDDDRTTVAFELLAESAKKVQILYFTHLARDVEKAHDAVPDERLFTHTIGVS